MTTKTEKDLTPAQINEMKLRARQGKAAEKAAPVATRSADRFGTDPALDVSELECELAGLRKRVHSLCIQVADLTATNERYRQQLVVGDGVEVVFDLITSGRFSKSQEMMVKEFSARIQYVEPQL